jgi:3-isopropylmalate/(R)-2-methylmalate dehydratase small subunit
MKFQGKVHKLPANVDTDAIIPARYLSASNPEELASHCLEGIDPDFTHKIKPGDILVADTNFGCGSSREHAPLAIKACSISCIIAQSFARIFFRNAINIGLPVLECEQANELHQGDAIEVDLEEGRITDNTTGKVLWSKPYPPFIQVIIQHGGLTEYTRKRLDEI